MKTWIEFVDAGRSPSGITRLWHVVPIETDMHAVIGVIAWYGPWRKYTFQAQPRTVFEEDCLRQIAEFCEKMTKEHKSKSAD